MTAIPFAFSFNILFTSPLLRLLLLIQLPGTRFQPVIVDDNAAISYESERLEDSDYISALAHWHFEGQVSRSAGGNHDATRKAVEDEAQGLYGSDLGMKTNSAHDNAIHLTTHLHNPASSHSTPPRQYCLPSRDPFPPQYPVVATPEYIHPLAGFETTTSTTDLPSSHSPSLPSHPPLTPAISAMLESFRSSKVKRIVFCTGKIYYTLKAQRSVSVSPSLFRLLPIPSDSLYGPPLHTLTIELLQLPVITSALFDRVSWHFAFISSDLLLLLYILYILIHTHTCIYRRLNPLMVPLLTLNPWFSFDWSSCHPSPLRR